VIKYYTIDAEILFSRAPFLQDNAEEFSYVKPFLTHVQTIEGASKEALMQSYVMTSIPMPACLANKNVVIEVNGADK
jgi:hypothetical protein